MRLRYILIIIGLIVSVIFGCMLGAFGSGIFVPVNGVPTLFKSFIPVISVPAESIFPPFKDVPFLADLSVNTVFTTIIVDIVIIVLALLGRAGMDFAKLRPKSFLGNAWESFVDYLYRNYMVPTLGARAKVAVPVAITAFVFILVCGMMELVPGIETIGIVEDAAHVKKVGYCYTTVSGVTLVTGVKADDPKGCQGGTAAPPHAQAESEMLASAAVNDTNVGRAATDLGVLIIPILRRPTSDLSTTLALALIAFVFIEIQGFRANGRHYLDRFFNFAALRGMGKGMMLGLINMITFGVGFLELLSEFIRIISFAFRLFGNMFAGTILVVVMTYLLPFALPSLFVGLEFAVAVIQPFVFMMLVVVFTSLAVAHTEH